MNNSFLKNVDDMFIAAAEHIDLPEGLADKIRFCNATYVTRFGVRLRGKMFTSLEGGGPHIQPIIPLRRGAFGLHQM